MPDETASPKSETADPTDEQWATFQENCRVAFNKMFALARRLHPRGETPETVTEYGRGLGRIAAEHDLTVEEAVRYGTNVWLRTKGEFHA